MKTQILNVAAILLLLAESLVSCSENDDEKE
jgi:hypothetical protein